MQARFKVVRIEKSEGAKVERDAIGNYLTAPRTISDPKGGTIEVPGDDHVLTPCAVATVVLEPVPFAGPSDRIQFATTDPKVVAQLKEGSEYDLTFSEVKAKTK